MTSLKPPKATIETRWTSNIAGKLRAKASLHEKQPEPDHQSDLELVARHFWRWAIVSSVACFLAAPAMMLLIGSILPTPVQAALWFLIKVCMAMACLAVAAAMRLTVRLHNQQ